MKVFDIQTGYNYSQNHSVVAENMAEAERIFMAKYFPTTIKSITLHSEYVQIQTYDEQEKVMSKTKERYEYCRTTGQIQGGVMKNDVGAAFPQPCTDQGHAANSKYDGAGGGMSLRDYFAAKALEIHPYNAHEIEAIVKYCYKLADAMLAERDKKEK